MARSDAGRSRICAFIQVPKHPHEAQQPEVLGRRCTQHQEQEELTAWLSSILWKNLGAVAEQVQPEAPAYVQKLDAQGRAYATGKRKDAVARVWIKPGSGKILINGREFVAYFARPVLQIDPAAADHCPPIGPGQYDVVATVAGGGLSGQAGAVRHGISKSAGRIMSRSSGVS